MDSRELDALVAEKVWGLDRHPIPKNSLPDAFGKPNAFPREDSFILADGSHAVYFVGNGNDSYRPGDGRELWPGHMPRYSTDIAAAWQVEERIIDIGYGIDYADFLGDIVDEGQKVVGDWYAQFRRIHATPRQRCLAALRAVGVEVSK